MVNNDDVIISNCLIIRWDFLGSPAERRAAFLFQPPGAGDEFHHTLYVAGPFDQIWGGSGGIALQGIGEAGGNEGRLSGGEF